jgi:hypothetical protein
VRSLSTFFATCVVWPTCRRGRSGANEQVNIPGGVWHRRPDMVRSAQSVKTISAALSPRQPWSRYRRRQARMACHLLSVRLLDAMECRQARTDNGLPKRRPVSERHRRLSVRTPAGKATPAPGQRRIARRLVQGLAKSAAERQHALLDDGGHFADVTNRFAPIVENPRAPFDLRRERVDLRFVLFRLVL